MADGEPNEEGSRTPLKDYTNVLVLSKNKTRKLNLSESGGGETIKEAEIDIGEDTNQCSDSSDQQSNYSVPTSPSKNNTDADTTDYESADEGTYPQKASKTPSECNAEPKAVDRPSFDSNLKASNNPQVDNKPNFVQSSLEFNSPTNVNGEIKVVINTTVESNIAEESKKSFKVNGELEIDEQPSFQNCSVEESGSPVKVGEAIVVAEATNSPVKVTAKETESPVKFVVEASNSPANVVAELEIDERPSFQNCSVEESGSPVKVCEALVVAEATNSPVTVIAKESESPVKFVVAELEIKEQSSFQNCSVEESGSPVKVCEAIVVAEATNSPVKVTAKESESPVKIVVEASNSPANVVAELEIKEQPSFQNLFVEESESIVTVCEAIVVAEATNSPVKVTAKESESPVKIVVEASNSPVNVVAELEIKEQPSFHNLFVEESESIVTVCEAIVVAEATNSPVKVAAKEPERLVKFVVEASNSPAVAEKNNPVDSNSATEESKQFAQVEIVERPIENLVAGKSIDSNLIAEISSSPEKVDAIPDFVVRRSIDNEKPKFVENGHVDPNLFAEELNNSACAEVEQPSTKKFVTEESKGHIHVNVEPVVQSSIDSNLPEEKSQSLNKNEPEESVNSNLVADESKKSPKVDAETIDAKLQYLLNDLLDKHSPEDGSEKSIDKIETDLEESIFISGSINCKNVNIHRSRLDLSCTESPIPQLNSSEGNNSRTSHDSELNHSNASANLECEYSFNFNPCNVSSPEELVIFKKPFDKKKEKLSLKQALTDQEIAQRLNTISVTCTNRDLSSIQEETLSKTQEILKNIDNVEEGSVESSTDTDILKSEIPSTSSSFIREDSLEPAQTLFSKTNNTMDKSFNGLQELYETCSKQERELGCTDVVEPVLFNLSFAAEAKKLADDISKMDINGEDLDDIKPPQYMMQSSLPPDINNSEAGPVTADEDFNKSDYFQEGSFDFEYLSKFENKTKRTALSRDSLFLKFDPLVGELVSGDLNASNMSERGPDTTVIENNRTPSRNDTAPLVDITPLGRRSVHSTPSGTKSQGNTPTLKQEVLSKEISKLQHLMVQQEAAHQELLLEKTDEVENLRKRVAELETKTPRDIEERIKFLESENAKLHKELKESLASNKQLTTVMAEYEKTISQLVTNKEEMVSQYEKTKDEIAQERDTAISHLNNMEVAFNDVHVKYEKVKSIVELQHGNEKLLKESLEAHTKTIEQQKSNYEKLKRHASEKLDGANREILTLKSNHQMEMAKMNAVAKKSDLKIKSLEESLEQKQKEIRELTQICDELIEQQDKIFGEEAIVEKNKENHLNLTYQLPSPRKEKRKKKSTIMNIFK